MKFHLLALFKFTICTNGSCDQNLRTFALIVHNSPLKVESTELYSLVKHWKASSDID